MHIPDIEQVIEIAERAGEKILRLYKKDGLAIQTKDDNSPVTEADLASHNYIVASLSEISTSPVLSEEDPIEFDIRKNWRSFWLVDPLDGTKDFIHHTDEFTVNIGLVHEHQPILGVVYIPAWGVTYYAQRGKGAFKREGGSSTPIQHPGPRDNPICLESRFHTNEKTTDFCKRYGIKELVPYGSSIKMCKIAEGAADVYPRYEPTKEWDTAAAHCILNEAKGTLLDGGTSKELLYNKPSIKNNSVIALGNGVHFSL